VIDFVENGYQIRGDPLDVLWFLAEFELQEMQKPLLRVSQEIIGSIDFSVRILRLEFLRLRESLGAIRMELGLKSQKFLFELFGIEPGPPRFVQQREAIVHNQARHTWSMR
jgi:hypothetical protein